MPDYKEMYLKMFRASEEAVNILIAAQRECEEMYIAEPDPPIRVLPSVKPDDDRPPSVTEPMTAR